MNTDTDDRRSSQRASIENHHHQARRHSVSVLPPINGITQEKRKTSAIKNLKRYRAQQLVSKDVHFPTIAKKADVPRSRQPKLYQQNFPIVNAKAKRIEEAKRIEKFGLQSITKAPSGVRSHAKKLVQMWQKKIEINLNNTIINRIANYIETYPLYPERQMDPDAFNREMLADEELVRNLRSIAKGDRYQPVGWVRGGGGPPPRPRGTLRALSAGVAALAVACALAHPPC